MIKTKITFSAKRFVDLGHQ